MKKKRNYRDFEQELRKQERAFGDPTKRGMPHRFYVTHKAKAYIWLAVAAVLLVCALMFVFYEILYREGLWLMALIFAGAALISVVNGREYLRKDRAAPREGPTLPEKAEH